MSEYERGRFDMFNLISSVWYGKQCYFMQDNGIIYSRYSGKYMRAEDSYSEFISMIGDY